MVGVTVVVLVAMLSMVSGNPVDLETVYGEVFDPQASSRRHTIQKRFINPGLTYGGFVNSGFTKMRTKRSYEEDCEKLELCKLHARSAHNFLAAYELYFVNRENAKLWDHHARSMRACEEKFGDCQEK